MSVRQSLRKMDGGPTDGADPFKPTIIPGEEDLVAWPFLAWQLGALSILHRMSWIRFLLIKGGRRVRKTGFGLQRLIMKVFRRPPGSEVGYINRTIKQARATAWRRLKRHFLYPNNWMLEGQPNENEMVIPLLGGRLIRLLGCEDPDALRGFELSDAFMDEASVNEKLPETMSNAIEPMIADKEGTVDISFTSRGRGYHYQQHWMGDAQNPDRREEYLGLTVPQSRVGTIPAAEALRYRQMNGDDIADQEYECKDLDYVGLAVHQYVHSTAPEGNDLPVLWYAGLKPYLNYYATIDYARSSGTTVREVWAVDRHGRIIFVDEMALPGGTPDRLAEQIKQQDKRLARQAGDEKAQAAFKVVVNVGGRDCFHKESSGKSMSDHLSARGVSIIPCNFSLVDAVLQLNQMCRQIEPADYDPVGDGLPMLLLVEGQCPKLRWQMMMIEHEDLEKKSQHMKDALDCARMTVMQNYRAVPVAERITVVHGGRLRELLALAGGDRGGRRRHPTSGRPL